MVVLNHSTPRVKKNSTNHKVGAVFKYLSTPKKTDIIELYE